MREVVAMQATGWSIPVVAPAAGVIKHFRHNYRTPPSGMKPVEVWRPGWFEFWNTRFKRLVAEHATDLAIL